GGAPCTPGRRLRDGGERILGRISPLGAGMAVIAEPVRVSSRPEDEKRGLGNLGGVAKRRGAAPALPRGLAFATLSNQRGGGVGIWACYSRVHVIRPAGEVCRPRRLARSSPIIRHIGHTSSLEARPRL